MDILGEVLENHGLEKGHEQRGEDHAANGSETAQHHHDQHHHRDGKGEHVGVAVVSLAT